MEILISAKNIISTILALLLLPIPILMPPTESYEAKNPDELKTSFTVLSDIHIEGNKYSTFEKFTEILKDVKGAKYNDTLVFLGDNTMNGQDIESIFFYGALKATNPADNLVQFQASHLFVYYCIYQKRPYQYLKATLRLQYPDAENYP